MKSPWRGASLRRMRVKPSRSGLVVAMPERGGRALAAAGEDVPESTYWLRRLADGDVLRVTESEPVERVEQAAPSRARTRSSAPSED